jgi:hypothetical protein
VTTELELGDLLIEVVALHDDVEVVSLLEPLALLGDGQAQLRRRIVETSDQAFGRSTATSWSSKFTRPFLGQLAAFHLLFDGSGSLVGWSGHRAMTLEGRRVVYFASTGLLPCWQGHGIVPSLQRTVLQNELVRHALPVDLCVRTRNPNAYELVCNLAAGPVLPGSDGIVPVTERSRMKAVADWLDVAVDVRTAVVRDAYPEPLYGVSPHSSHPDAEVVMARLGPCDALLVIGSDTAAV